MARKDVKIESYCSHATPFLVDIISSKYPFIRRNVSSIENFIGVRDECRRKFILREIYDIRFKQLLKDDK